MSNRSPRSHAARETLAAGAYIPSGDEWDAALALAEAVERFMAHYAEVLPHDMDAVMDELEPNAGRMIAALDRFLATLKEAQDAD